MRSVNCIANCQKGSEISYEQSWHFWLKVVLEESELSVQNGKIVFVFSGKHKCALWISWQSDIWFNTISCVKEHILSWLGQRSGISTVSFWSTDCWEQKFLITAYTIHVCTIHRISQERKHGPTLLQIPYRANDLKENVWNDNLVGYVAQTNSSVQQLCYQAKLVNSQLTIWQRAFYYFLQSCMGVFTSSCWRATPSV